MPTSSVMYMSAILSTIVLSAPVQAQMSQPPIEEGSKVTLEMTISVPDDHLIIPPHTSEYTHGAKQLIPGLEQALVGLHAGEKKNGSNSMRTMPSANMMAGRRPPFRGLSCRQRLPPARLPERRKVNRLRSFRWQMSQP